MGGNAVTTTVSWHLVEPVEGSYDFSGVDPLVDMARERGLALTLLWFGAFKNAASTYAPRWVRADAERFPRADLGGAGGAGARPGARGTAGRLWRERGRRACGTWAEVFGEDEWAQEVFMAWGFASYCGALAAAGARHLDVPFHVNAWLGPQPGQDLPGRYPSGGPVAGVVDVWKAAAPALALLGPDIYVDDVKAAVAGYVREDNALLVPESRPAAGNLLWAVGRGVIGFNVFGVDDVRADGRLAAAYRLLAGAEEVIIAAQRSGRIRPVLLEAGQTAVVGLTWTLCGSGEVPRSMFLDAGVQVRTEAGAGEPETTDEALVAAPADTRATAVLVDLGDDELLAIGQRLMFEVAGAPGEVVEIDDAVEARYEAGAWVSGRNLNGDERLNLLPLDRPAAVRIRVLRRRA